MTYTGINYSTVKISVYQDIVLFNTEIIMNRGANLWVNHIQNGRNGHTMLSRHVFLTNHTELLNT